MTLPIDRTSKTALDSNLVNGNTSDAPVIKSSNDVVYNTIDELYNYTSNLVAGGVLQPYPAFLSRQALINGNFDVWQRGTSFSASGVTYTADRWQINSGSVSRQAFTPGQSSVPNNPNYFLRSDCSSAPSDPQLVTKIEDVGTLAGQEITISFWAKADSSITFSEGGYVTQNFGSGGSSEVATNIGSYSLTTSWQKIAKTVTLPSISGKTIGANNHLYLRLDPPNSTSVIFDIAQVQINAGDQTLPFQPKSYNQENMDCLRYRWQSWTDGVVSPSVGSLSGVAISTSAILVNVKYPVPMRISPTVSVTNNNVPNQIRTSKTNAAVAATFSSVAGASNKGFAILSFTGTPLTLGEYYDFDIIADAEL